MSRSGYTDDFDDDGMLYLFRQAVAQAIKGKRGQQFLRDLVVALDALPTKRLIEGELVVDGEVCALGSVGKLRGLSMDGIDTEDSHTLALLFGIAPSMAREIMYENDEGTFGRETPEARWTRMRQWAVSALKVAP